MIKYLFLFLILITTSYSAIAGYDVAIFRDNKIDFNKPTRVLVLGTGAELMLRFNEVAKSKALRLKQIFPDDQIILIGHRNDKLNSTKNLTYYGFNILRKSYSIFDSHFLVLELLKFKKINSIDIFTHSSATSGGFLESNQFSLKENEATLKKLRSRMAPNAYVLFHGCNTGFYLANNFGKSLKIAAFGSLTSTDFVVLNEDGNFYRELNGLHPNKNWAKVNNVSFDKEIACRFGACSRMNPDNISYRGYWGVYGAGLTFYKSFCDGVDRITCLKSMAHFQLSQVTNVNLKKSSSIEEYKKSVKDLICPSTSDPLAKIVCELNLETAQYYGNYDYTPARGGQFECNDKECFFKIVCNGSKKCTIDPTVTGGQTTVREYIKYLSAFEYLNTL